MSEQTLDRWADWLEHGRTRGMTDTQRRRSMAALNRVRDRVLRNARLKPGMRILDVGAGTGLLALSARKKLGPKGEVVALDVSSDALRICLESVGPDDGAAPVRAVAGDLLRLPIADRSVDAVLTRSALIYVEDRQAAIRELFRVLRAPGVASIFEPINQVARPTADAYAEKIGEITPEFARVRALTVDPSTRLLGFDERDMLRWFREAGFGYVKVAYEEVRYLGAKPPKRGTVAALLTMRHNPLAPSHEEAARELLGEEADAYLVRVAKAMLSLPQEHHSGILYLRALRQEAAPIRRRARRGDQPG